MSEHTELLDALERAYCVLTDVIDIADEAGSRDLMFAAIHARDVVNALSAHPEAKRTHTPDERSGR